MAGYSTSALNTASAASGGGAPGSLRSLLRLVPDKAQIGPLDVAHVASREQLARAYRRRREIWPRCQNLAGPPRAKRVVKKKEDHVVFSEELRDGGKFVGADLGL